MTLQELLDLKLVHDNVCLKVFTKDTIGLGNFTEEYNINRIFGRPVKKEDFIKNGVREELFSLPVVELWGYKANKMSIVVETEGGLSARDIL